jgi:predicted N-acyltransferase
MPPITADPPQLTVRWDNAIDAVGEPAWQATAHDRSFFLSYPWLLGAERTLTPDPCYLSLWRADNDDPVACAPAQHIAPGASYFYYDLPRMLSDADTVAELAPFLTAEEKSRLAATAELLRERSAQLYPALLAVANGMAAGLCLHPDLRDGERAAVAEAAVVALTTRARSMDAPVAGLLYLARGDDPELAASLATAGFVSGTVAAECVMPVHWDSFDEYAESFGKKRRYAIRREAAAFERAGLGMEVGDATALGPEIAELQAQLRVKYGHPGDTASILRSYHRMRERLGPYVRVFIARRGSAAVGFLLVLADGDRYYTKSIGFDYTALGQDFCYFTVLFYEPVRRAIAEGVRLIHYGVDSYDAKITRGCRLRLLDAVVQFTGPLAPCLGEAFALHTRATAERFRQLAEKHQ